MLLSGLPPLVREGDRFRATFTVRNAAHAAARRRAHRAHRPRRAALPAQNARRALAPGAGARARLGRRRVPPAATSLAWQVDAAERDAPSGARRAGDALKVTQRVRARGARAHVPGDAPAARRSRRRSRSSGRPTRSPAAAASTSQMQAKLAGELPGVRDFLRTIRYTCLEQQASVAIGLRDRARWDAADERAARLSRPRRARQVLAAHARRRRRADRVPAVDRATRPGIAIPDRERARMEQALDRLRRRPHRPLLARCRPPI